MSIKRFCAFGLVAACLLIFVGLMRLPAEMSDASPSCGTAWEVVTTPAVPQPSVLYDVSGTSPNDLWAVGSSNGPFSLLLHWDGSAWTQPNSGPRPFPSSFGGVAAVSTADAWAVGSGGGAQTLTMRWDGSAWNAVPSQSPGTTFNTLSDVAVVSANDVWAVGSSSSSPGVSQALIEHWDGSTWSVVSSLGGSALSSVTAISPNDVWAVGYEGSIPQSSTFLAHWDGSLWSEVDGPTPSASFTSELRLTSVAAVSANDVWAIGGFVSSGGPQTLIEHFDGSAWAIVPSPNSATTYDQLLSIAAVAVDDVWAVGRADSKQSSERSTLVKHWNGETWSVVDSPNPSATSNTLIGVAAITPGDLWAVGATDYQSGPPSNLFALHFCGELSTPTPTPPPVQTTLSKDAPAGSSSLAVAEGAGFHLRDAIIINPGGATEERSVIGAFGSLHLSAPLLFTHVLGEQVVQFGQAVAPGDADCDGSVNSVDALRVLRRVANLTPYSICWAAGNVGCLDDINAVDALRILRFVAGLPPNLPAQCPAIGQLPVP